MNRDEWIGPCPRCGSDDTGVETENYESFAVCHSCGARKIL